MSGDRQEIPKATGRDIILTIGKTMIEGLEPLVTRTLAPSLYQVYLHAEDHDRLRHVFPEIELEAREHLDRELERLNERSQPLRERLDRAFGAGGRGTGTLLDRLPAWLGRLLRFLGAEAWASGGAMRFESADGQWHVQFQKDPGGTLQAGDVEVVAELAVGEEVRYGSGSRTHRITSTTRRLGEMETRRRVREVSAGESGSGAVCPLAWFRFADLRGPQTYAMEKDEIVIGRQAEDAWVDLHLETAPAVSREHARVRYRGGTFTIKDLSTNGTVVDGRALRPSVVTEDGRARDVEHWEELPDGATIELASAVTLTFEVARR